MIPLAIYLIKVILISGLLFGYYALVLRNQRFHEWNRYYLISSAAVSLIIPFIRWSALFSHFSHQPAYVARLHTFTTGAAGSATTGALSQQQWLELAYGLVAMIFILGLCGGLVKICSRIKTGQRKKFPLFTLVEHPKTISPFSFFRYIFWSDQLSITSRSGEHILRHELAHVQQKHSLDKLYLEIITCLCWINPFFYLMRRELSIIHEFIADRKACAHNAPQEYASLLVEQSLRPGNPLLTHAFFQKQLSRRVHMLIRENKNRFTYFKRLMAIPITLLVIFCFLYLQSDAGSQNIPLLTEVSLNDLPLAQSIKQPDPTQGIASAADREAKTHHPATEENSNHEATSVANKIFTFVEKMPSFPRGERALLNYLKNHIRYPEAARKDGAEGTVVVQFIVGADGHIDHVKSVGSLKGHGLEQEAIRVVKAMPAWIPGSQNGHPVTVQYNLPVRFSLHDSLVIKNPFLDADNPAPPPPPAPEPPSLSGKGKVFSFVEQMPRFPGGEGSLMTFLSRHIHYPDDARENGIQGTVVIQFIVGTDGKLSRVHAVGTPKGGGLEDEAVRVVKEMPPWQPGKQNGTDVAVQYNLPVRFVLQ